jgi:malonate transporter MadM subunit
MEILNEVLISNNLITAFVFVGLIVYLSYFFSNYFTGGRFHGSAIAIILGLIFAYMAGLSTEGQKGVADFAILSGVGILGGSMLRDFAIVATAYGANFNDLRSSGKAGVFSLLFGVILSFSFGALVAISFGYDDPRSITTNVTVPAPMVVMLLGSSYPKEIATSAPKLKDNITPNNKENTPALPEDLKSLKLAP